MSDLFVLVWFLSIVLIVIAAVGMNKNKKLEKPKIKGFLGRVKNQYNKILKKEEEESRVTGFWGKLSYLQWKKTLITSIIIFVVSFIGIGITAPPVDNSSYDNTLNENINDKNTDNEISNKELQNNELNEEEIKEQERQEEIRKNEENKKNAISNLPTYNNSPYIIINDNNPFFIKDELVTTSYEQYSDLDSLGRCGVAIANIGKDILPTESRGNIGSVKPTGWHTVKYNGIDGNYLYNRCHLIGFQLSGENANEKNLITGTRYLNVNGMLPFENMVSDYVKETNNHVLYRVTPIFKEQNLLASGVLIEAQSVEDNGSGVKFNVYCYNIQPGIEINYANGESNGPEFTGSEQTTPNTNTKTKQSTNSNSSNSSNTNNASTNTQQSTSANSSSQSTSKSVSTKNETSSSYVLNTNTKKFHYPSCGSAKQISAKNRQNYDGSRNEIISRGYSSCKKCNP